MDYNIKFQPYNNLYYARIPDGSKYGRKVQAKTKQALMDKLKNLWVMPSKQTKNAMTVGDAIHTFENYIDLRVKGTIDQKPQMAIQTKEEYNRHLNIIKKLSVRGEKIIQYKVDAIDKNFMNDVWNSIIMHFDNHSDRYHKHHIRTFKTALLHLHEKNMDAFPLSHVLAYKIKKTQKKTFSPKRKDALKIFSAIEHCLKANENFALCREKYAIFLLLCAFGLRASEANALTKKDFDFDEQSVTLNKIVDRKGNFYNRTKTLGSTRDVILGKNLIEQIKNYFIRLDVWFPQNQWLFPSPVNLTQPLRQGTLRESSMGIIKKYLKNDISWEGAMHPLRHYFTSVAMIQAPKLDKNITWVSNLVGHSDQSTTANIYTHDITENSKQIGDVLEESLFKSV